MRVKRCSTTLSDVILLLSSSNGKQPHSRMNAMTPRAQMSTALSYACRFSISGAMYPRVPRNDPAMDRSGSIFESPKSIIFTSASAPACVKSRFSGLRSRWMMPCWCMWSTADVIFARIRDASASESVPLLTT